MSTSEGGPTHRNDEEAEVMHTSRAARLQFAATIVLLALLVTAGCNIMGLDPPSPPDPEPNLLAPVSVELSLDDFAAELAATSYSEATKERIDRLRRLTQIFYGQFVNRRINSKATFDDPSLREFFETEESFADYYADLVQSLTDRYFDSVKPTSITVRSFRVEEGADRVIVNVRFIGDNRLPLRFWTTSYTREDVWEASGRKWWIVPGKV